MSLQFTVKLKERINMKKIIIFFSVIICIYVIFKVYTIVKIKSEWECFKPFFANNKLMQIDTDFKIDGNIKIESASAFYPFTANLVQNIFDKENYSEDNLKIVSTSEAFYDIVNKNADLIIATAPSDDQKEYIESCNVELEFQKLYLEPLVIFVNNNNKVDNLTIEQLQKMYYTSNTSWNEFGGEASIIHTYQLEKNNGSQTCFESIVKNNIIDKKHYEINTMPKIIDKVAKDNNGIGYAFYSYYEKMHKNNNVKTINIEGKKISEEDYPLLFDVYAIYRKDNNNDTLKQIVNWLDSDAGKGFIENSQIILTNEMQNSIIK